MPKRFLQTGFSAGFSVAAVGLLVVLLLLSCRVSVAATADAADAFTPFLPARIHVPRSEAHTHYAALLHRCAQMTASDERPCAVPVRRQGTEVVRQSGGGKKRGSGWLADASRQKPSFAAPGHACANGFVFLVTRRPLLFGSRSSRAPPSAPFPVHGAACSVASSP